MAPPDLHTGSPVKVSAPNGEDAIPLVELHGHANKIIEKANKYNNKSGMSWIVTALFIVGETAGGGLIALPSAMIASGVVWGSLTNILGALICTYTGIQLAENWTILQKRFPKYREHCRKPYPAMGEKALGKQFSYFVSLLLDVTMFGTAVVFLLLAAKNIETFFSIGGYQIRFCRLIVIVAVFILPVTMLKSPKDFWFVIIIAMFTTLAAVVVIIYGAISDGSKCQSVSNYPPLNINRAAMGFGTVMFAYGGHGAFPTIQHDMKKPYQFNKAVILAFILITCLYLPVSIIGYAVYGDSLLDTIIPSLQITEVRFTVNLLITVHVILALTIIFNPLNQELEDYLNISQDFGWQRFFLRSCVMMAVVLVAISIPTFGVLLDLVGGSTITTMALVFPAIFNLYLKAGAKRMLSHTSAKDLLINSGILLAAAFGGSFATITAVQAMIGSEYATPCWWGLVTSAPQTNLGMNIFRFSADTAHLVAIVILLHKIWKSRSCEGISGRSQLLFAVVFISRYLDLFTNFISAYNSAMKLFFLASSIGTVYLMWVKFKATYDRNNDSLRIEFLVVPCILLALVINHEFTFMEILWTFSIYLESVAIMPQLFMLSRTGNAETITAHYLFALGSYRALYIVNWIYRYYTESFFDPIAVVAGIVQTVLYADFFYLYVTRVLQSNRQFEMPA